MKKESMRKYSLLGLVLLGASVVTAAVLPKDDVKRVNNGTLVPTSDGGDLTCQGTVRAVQSCTYTATNVAASRTSTAGETSDITLGFNNVRTISTNAAGTPGVNNIHTSEDNS